MTEPLRTQSRIVQTEEGEIAVDSTGAMLIEQFSAVPIETSYDSVDLVGVELYGRINLTAEYARLLMIADWRGIARLVSMLVETAHDIDPRFEDELMSAIRDGLE